jgi:hypothetical protein
MLNATRTEHAAPGQPIGSTANHPSIFFGNIRERHASYDQVLRILRIVLAMYRIV